MLGSAVLPRAFADPASGPRIGIGIIGSGARGQQLIGFLNEMPQFDVAAYCDVLPFRLDEARAQLPGARAYADYRHLLEDRKVDAVVIATHLSAHFSIAMDALDAGKHVYCEKTLTKGIDESLSLARKARDNSRLTFQTGYQFRSSALYERAAEMIARGVIGPVIAVNCQWNRNGDWRRPVPDPKYERLINWRMYREYSSGLVAELSSHQMDFCNRILAGSIERIHGEGGIDYWKDGRETYDNVHVVCRYSSGITAKFTSLTANSLDGYRIAVLGKKGSIVLTFAGGWLIPEGDDFEAADEVDLVSGASVSAGGQADSRSGAARAYGIDAPTGDPTPAALAAFADSIVHERQPSADVSAGARAAIMVQMAIEAMDTGTVIEWRPGFDAGVGPTDAAPPGAGS